MAKKIKYRNIIVFIGIIVSLTLAYLRGGDLLIGYLARSMGIKIFYSNWCNALDAYTFRMAKLNNFELRISGAPVSVQSGDMLIVFDYSKLLSSGAIGVECTLNTPMFKIEKSQGEATETSFFEYIPNEVSSIFGEISGYVFEEFFCNILLRGDRAQIKSCRLFSKDMIIDVDGVISRHGDLDLRIQGFFTQKFIENLPNEALSMFEQEKSGWYSLEVKIKSDTEISFFRVESDRFKLVIGEEAVD